MKILIDCTQIALKKAGVGIYAHSLVRELILIRSSVQLFLLVQDDDPEFNLQNEPGLTVVRVKSRYARIMPLRFLIEQIYIPFLVFKLKIDVIHSLHYSFPLLPTRAKSVVTVHDMTAYLMPELHLSLKIQYFRFFLWAASRSRHQLIFVSHSTLTDFLFFFPQANTANYVIPLGKGPSFHPGLNPVLVGEVALRYKIRSPYILFLGTIEPRKNLPRLVGAYAQLINSYPDHRLVIAGMKGWHYEALYERIDVLRLKDSVLFVDYVDEKDKPYLIQGAEIFVYPSLYEGFGIPVLEAMACGVPTITSNLSSMPEVAGDGAILVDPKDEDGIARAMDALLQSTSLRQSLSKKALDRSAQFEWSKTARQTLEVYLGELRGEAVID
jgi:glycosyltransferase involved in cell wall biosynthesis